MKIYSLIKALTNSASEGMFERGWLDIGGTLYDFLCQILYWCIKGLCQLVNWITMTFYYLTGNMDYFEIYNLDSLFPSVDFHSGTISGGILFNGSDESGGDFFVNGNLNTNNALVQGTIVFLIVALFMLIFSICIGIYKAATNKDGNGHVIGKETFWSTLTSLIKLVVAPIFIFITIGTVTSVLTLIGNAFTGALTGSGDEPLAVVFYKLCLPDYGKTLEAANWEFYKIEDGVTNYFSIRLPNIIATTTDPDELINGQNLYEVYNMNLYGEGHFNYMLGFIGCIFAVVALGLLVIRLAERIIEIVSDYLYALPCIATTPADGGERFKTWKELFAGHLISWFGSYVGIIIYLYILRVITPNLTKVISSTKNNIAVSLVFSTILLVIVIGGAFATVKGGNMVAQLIGVKAGQAEANSMQQSMGLAHMGASATKTATKLVGGAVVGKALAMKKGAQASGAQINLNNLNSAKRNGGGSSGLGGGGGLASSISSGLNTMATGGSSGSSSGSSIPAFAKQSKNIKNRISSLKEYNANNVARGQKGLGAAGYVGAFMAGLGSEISSGLGHGISATATGLNTFSKNVGSHLDNKLFSGKIGANMTKFNSNVKSFGNKIGDNFKKVTTKIHDNGAYAINSAMYGREKAGDIQHIRNAMRNEGSSEHFGKAKETYLKQNNNYMKFTGKVNGVNTIARTRVERIRSAMNASVPAKANKAYHFNKSNSANAVNWTAANINTK